MKAITVENRQKVSEFSLLSAIVNEKITFSCSTQDDLNPRKAYRKFHLFVPK